MHEVDLVDRVWRAVNPTLGASRVDSSVAQAFGIGAHTHREDIDRADVEVVVKATLDVLGVKVLPDGQLQLHPDGDEARALATLSALRMTAVIEPRVDTPGAPPSVHEPHIETWERPSTCVETSPPTKTVRAKRLPVARGKRRK